MLEISDNAKALKTLRDMIDILNGIGLNLGREVELVYAAREIIIAMTGIPAVRDTNTLQSCMPDGVERSAYCRMLAALDAYGSWE